MKSIKDLLKPIGRGNGRRTAMDVYETLQTSILSGKLQPGTIVSQVQLAQALNVSRTPVREAMRMLQEGGLLVGEPNYRSRVVGFDPQDIEALYIKRVALEALAVTITTRRLTAETVKKLRAVVRSLEGADAHNSFEKWQNLHRQLHGLIVVGSGSVLTVELEQLERRSERYQSAYKGAHLIGWWHRGEAEHRELSDAICSRNAALAGELAARHLARTALELLAALAPEYDSSRLRASLRFAIDGTAHI